MRKNAQRGVTLLELMIVVTLLAIVASFGSGAYSGYIDKARMQRAIAEIAHISTKIAEYDTRPDRPGGGLPNNLAEIGLDPSYLTDPWGNPYQYLNLGPLAGVGGARKDHNNVQLNNDYDLYSMGKNGTTNQTFTSRLSQDDIVRGASGGYIGTPAEYAQLPNPY